MANLNFDFFVFCAWFQAAFTLSLLCIYNFILNIYCEDWEQNSIYFKKTSIWKYLIRKMWIKTMRYHFQRGSILCMTIIMGICHYTLSKFLVQLDLDTHQRFSLDDQSCWQWHRLCMCGGSRLQEISVLPLNLCVCVWTLHCSKKILSLKKIHTYTHKG